MRGEKYEKACSYFIKLASLFSPDDSDLQHEEVFDIISEG